MIKNKIFDNLVVLDLANNHFGDVNHAKKIIKQFSTIIKKNGGNVFISKKKHSCGSDRVSEASSNFKSDIVINVQGDEPFVSLSSIKKIINFYKNKLNNNIPVVSLVYETKNPKLIEDKNCVKVVLDKDKFAMYLSRSKIPFSRNPNKVYNFYIHVGVYGFLNKSIIQFSRLKPSKLEKIEMIECMRFIENGQKIRMINIKKPTIGIDTPNDLIRAKKFLNSTFNV